jgi:RNA polymerase sigma-70 factor (ECF subfamily)
MRRSSLRRRLASDPRWLADPANFDQVANREIDRVYRYALGRTGDEHLAWDVTIEAFARAHRSWDSFDPSRPVYPWLKAIARNAAADLYASEKGQQERREALRELQPAEIDIDTLVMLDPEFAAAWRRLPADQQVAIWRHRVLGVPLQEAAADLGIGLSAFKQRLYRGLQALTEAMEKEAAHVDS